MTTAKGCEHRHPCRHDELSVCVTALEGKNNVAVERMVVIMWSYAELRVPTVCIKGTAPRTAIGDAAS